MRSQWRWKSGGSSPVGCKQQAASRRQSTPREAGERVISERILFDQTRALAEAPAMRHQQHRVVQLCAFGIEDYDSDVESGKVLLKAEIAVAGNTSNSCSAFSSSAPFVRPPQPIF
jgi:hypothetical protein